MRLTKSPAKYLQTREKRRELPYEAMLASGRPTWSVGDKVRVYRTTRGTGAVVDETETSDVNPPDYDAEHYVCVLRDTYGARLARAFTPGDFSTIFDDPNQFSLFAPPLTTIRPILRRLR